LHVNYRFNKFNHMMNKKVSNRTLRILLKRIFESNIFESLGIVTIFISNYLDFIDFNIDIRPILTCFDLMLYFDSSQN